MRSARAILSLLTAAVLTAALAVLLFAGVGKPSLPAGTPVASQTEPNEDGQKPSPSDSAVPTGASESPPPSASPPAATEAGTMMPETASPETDPSILRAEELLSGMTTWEKVCQLFIVEPESITGVSPTTAASELTKAGLARYPVGGIVCFSQNLVSAEQTVSMIERIQSFSRIGLFIAVDEEGGAVSRLMKKLGTTYVSSMFTYKDDGPETAYHNAAVIAGDMLSLGFNTDFAPVADVWSDKSNTVIGKRAYSDDFEEAAVLVAAAVKGYKDAGVICTLKHFPGHGGTAQDSHKESAYVDKTAEELMAQELLPFISGIDAGADMVMVGHLTVPALDDVPATLSYPVVTGLLRETLGYGGVVITDGLRMSALAGQGTSAEIAVKVIQAGGDILLSPQNLPEAVRGIMDALETGELTIDRINESVTRILLLKHGHGIIE